MSSKFFAGADLLYGDSTVPGVVFPKRLQDMVPKIFKAVSDFGCTHNPTVVQPLSHDEISEVAAYGGFPTRYPHWKWGAEYQELQSGYEHGMHRIYEMVVNTNPVYIYCLNSNTLMDNVTVIAHALGHADFFKNNLFFEPTTQNAMNQLANHGSRIRRIISRWGKERVTKFIDNVLMIETLIDPDNSVPNKIKRLDEKIIWDERKYYQERRINVPEGKEYMEDFINTPEFKKQEKERIEKLENEDILGIFKNITCDIFGFLKDNADLAPWQADIMSMLYAEAEYFAPQRNTKVMNEGWASFIDMQIMCRDGLLDLCEPELDGGLFDYAIHKMGVLGGKYSMNPYKLGYTMFLDIEDRYNKGKFGKEWEECDDVHKKENWDTGANLGKKAIFNVRRHHNDVTAIMEFFTQDFCEKNEFFQWKKDPNGDVKIVDRDWKSIRNKLITRHLNGGLPVIELVDKNFKGRNYLLLQHKFLGEPLYIPYIHPVLTAIYNLWKKPVFLSTKDQFGAEIVWVCADSKVDGVKQFSRKEVEGKDFI